MTEREQEIYQLIVKNPKISQQEIADILEITRSSVAVHISNLMKKGKILGKQYILQEEVYICVIGGVNIDIIATPQNRLIQRDSNPGYVEYSFGGVGRNIAENLARLGNKIELITVIGDDFHADALTKNCEELGISTNYALKCHNENTSTYICVNDEHGEMQLAISEMKIYEKLTKEYILAQMDIINRAQAVVLDTNIPEDVIEVIGDKCKRPIFVDPVSTTKALKVKKILSKIHTIKPNLVEAELLLDMKIENLKDIELAANRFLEKGLQQVFISLGEKGVYFADQQEHGRLKNQESNMVNTTGCGDAFMATVIYGYLNDKSAKESALLALKASKICLESKEAVSKNMTLENLLEDEK